MTKAFVAKVAIVVGVLCALSGSTFAQQPAQITLVEKGKLVHGSISMDKGSPWCPRKDQRMVWLVGHDDDEHPSCEESPGVWKENRKVTLPLRADKFNAKDDGIIDRHDCKRIYANNDDVPDIICLVGANKGRGIGYNELFLTKPDGSLQKVLRHGMQKYITMRTRMMNTLRGPNGVQLVFVSTRGKERVDKRTNIHRMFKVLRGQAKVNGREDLGYFEEVRGPWERYTVANAVVVGDVDGDGLDDFLVTNEKENAFLFIQKPGLKFQSVNMEGSLNWRGARIEDVTGDGIPDLVVTEGYRWTRNKPWKVKVFEGIGKAPYFNLKSPYFEKETPYPSADVAVMDVNGDGYKDIYVVQADEARDNYCGNPVGKPFNPQKWYRTQGFPRKGFVAPVDKAPDLLLVGTGTCQRFKVVQMNHRIPGCGFIVEKFGNDQTLIVSHGELARAGHNVVLSWERKNNVPKKQVPKCRPSSNNSAPDDSKPDDSTPDDVKSPEDFKPIVVLGQSEMVRTYPQEYTTKSLVGIKGEIRQSGSGLLSVHVDGRGVVWSNGYKGNAPFYYTVMQADGRVAMYSMDVNGQRSAALWQTGASRDGQKGPYSLVINSRETIAVVDRQKKVVWSDQLLKTIS